MQLGEPGYCLIALCVDLCTGSILKKNHQMNQVGKGVYSSPGILSTQKKPPFSDLGDRGLDTKILRLKWEGGSEILTQLFKYFFTQSSYFHCVILLSSLCFFASDSPAIKPLDYNPLQVCMM